MRKIIAMAALVAASFAASQSNAAILYDANTAAATDGSFFGGRGGVMQVITLAGGASSYTLNYFTVFGVRWNVAATTNQHLIVQFYTNIDTSPTSTNVLSGATAIPGFDFTLSPQAVGSYNYTLGSAAAPLNVALPGATVAIVASYLNNGETGYSTNIFPRFNTGTASVGSNDGFIYEDDNQDFIFAGSERQQFTGASGNPAPTELRMAIDATAAAVPEPTSFVALAPAGLLLARRRRA